MKKYFTLSIYLVLFTFSHHLLHAHNPENDSTSLQLKVKNIKHDHGKILIAVYNAEGTFMKNRYSEEAIRVSSFDDLAIKIKLPFGKYAISIFHDVNENNELNTNFIGIPKEPYGFSNNPKITFGPPNFKQTSFELGKHEHEIEIILNPHYALETCTPFNCLNLKEIIKNL
jgi:uncharacterized protein (DUF2141 family)